MKAGLRVALFLSGDISCTDTGGETPAALTRRPQTSSRLWLEKAAQVRTRFSLLLPRSPRLRGQPPLEQDVFVNVFPCRFKHFP